MGRGENRKRERKREREGEGVSVLYPTLSRHGLLLHIALLEDDWSSSSLNYHTSIVYNN